MLCELMRALLWAFRYDRGNDSMEEDQALQIFNGALEIEAKHSMTHMT